MNRVKPARKIRRRPIRSPRRPTSSSRPPNAIRYALTTQARFDCEKCRSLWIDGSATFTMVWSRMIIRKPAHSTTSATQRRRSSPACGWIWVSVVTSSPVRSFEVIGTTQERTVANHLLQDDLPPFFLCRSTEGDLRPSCAHRQLGACMGLGALRAGAAGPYADSHFGAERGGARKRDISWVSRPTSTGARRRRGSAAARRRRCRRNPRAAARRASRPAGRDGEDATHARTAHRSRSRPRAKWRGTGRRTSPSC